MKQKGITTILCMLFVVVPGSVVAAQPTVEQFKQVLEMKLQKLKPEGTTVRTVLFQDVIPGKPKGGSYPFQVTAVIHDYGPGFPKNRYYGETCVGKMDKWKFDLMPDDFGGWTVQGRMTVPGECKKNPSEGVSAIALASLPGKPAGKAASADAQGTAPAAPAAGDSGNLYLGEYACYGTGGTLLAAMGFHLKPGGKYHDLDGGGAGTYNYNARQGTISFRGGFLDGETGRDVRNTGFQLTSTIHCEPWKK
jgi:hypothetical protein